VRVEERAGIRGYRCAGCWGDPAQGVPAFEALNHLLGEAEDTVALFVCQLQRGFQAFVLQLVVMLSKDFNGFLADLRSQGVSAAQVAGDCVHPGALGRAFL
jgi:hypothetical protein